MIHVLLALHQDQRARPKVRCISIAIFSLLLTPSSAMWSKSNLTTLSVVAHKSPFVWSMRYMTDTMRFGASTVVVERATPEVLLQTIEKHKATVCFSTPSGYKLMLDEIDKYETSSLRLCIAGGEPLAPAVFHSWEEKTGVRIINGLGISELLISLSPPPATISGPGLSAPPSRL